jgi:hypothetical protein
MNNAWKWILGILALLLILGGVGMPLMMGPFYGFGGYGMMSNGGWGRMPMHQGYGGWSPMMGGGYGWMGVGLLLSGLIQLGLLVLIVLGIIWMVRMLNRQDRLGK